MILRLFSEPCMKPFYGQASRNQSVAHFPSLICNVSTGIRLRYSHHPRASRSQRCFNRSGLSSRLKPRRSRRSKPYRQDGVYPFSLFSEDDLIYLLFIFPADTYSRKMWQLEFQFRLQRKDVCDIIGKVKGGGNSLVIETIE